VAQADAACAAPTNPFPEERIDTRPYAFSWSGCIGTESQRL